MTDAVAGGGRGSRTGSARSGAGRAATEVTVRAIDVTLASVALLLLAPLLLALLVLVRWNTPGPGLFRQTRVGRNRRPFTMYKFRTMLDGCDHRIHQEYVARLLADRAEPSEGLYKLGHDPRITPVGRVLRRTSLDELPQLVNVLRGDMSLVGPRPSLPHEVAAFPEWATERFDVRPGITGLWQVSGRNRLTMLQGLRLDVDFVHRRSVRQYVSILLRTVPALLDGGGR